MRRRYLHLMRGMAIGVVLMVIALAMLIAFSMASMSIFHLRITSRATDAMCAQEMAESALSEALAQIAHNPKYESTASGGLGLADRSSSPSPGQWSVVAFNPATATREKMLQSFNNFYSPSADETESAVPYGSITVCPTGDVLISAKACYNGVYKYATGLVAFPQYQYAISSWGPILSSGPLMVASTTATPSGSASNTTAQEAYDGRGMGGNVASNDSGSAALSLGVNDKVMGDAVAHGGIVLAPSATVSGGIHQYAPPVGVPSVKVTDWNPLGTVHPQTPMSISTDTIVGSSFAPATPFVYMSPSPGNVITVSGNLNLASGTFVYVDGDLTVNGGIDGVGVVIVNGATHINGGGTMQSNANAALVSDKDVTLTGGGSSSTSAAYEGLVYTNGNFTASNMTVVGAFVGGGHTSSLTLQNANVIADSTRSSVSITVTPPPTSGTYNFTGSSSPFTIGVGCNISIFEYTQGGQPVYGTSLTPNTPALPAAQMWQALGAALLTIYQNGNPYHFSPNQVAALRGGNWQNTWTGLAGLGTPATDLTWLTSNGPPPAGPPTSSPSASTSTAPGTVKVDFNLNRFFQTDDQSHILLWEIIQPAVLGRITVIGSLNVDFVIRLPRFARPGETLVAADLTTCPGGKGGNQAYAAARLGASVAMVGCVGDDAHGTWLCAHLSAARVDVVNVRTVANSPTGLAVITVDGAGQNQIVIVPGANACVTDLPPLESGIVLLQLEIPLPTVLQAARQAQAAGALVILDPAPAIPLSDDLLRLADWITPNETELLSLLDEAGERVSPEEAVALGGRLLARGSRRVLVKLGDAGVVLLDGLQIHTLPAIPVVAVDTTAAGDTFNGAFAAALLRGEEAVSAARYAIRAAAFSVTRPGAQPSMPTPSDLNRDTSHFPA